MLKPHRPFNLVAAGIVGAMALCSQIPRVAGQTRAAGDQTTLAGQVEIARLVDLCAERLKLHVDYDATALKGTITLRIGESVGDDELWTITNRILAARGFASVQMPGSDGRSISIVKLADAPGMARIAHEATNDDRAGFVNLVTRIEHQPIKPIVDAVKLILSNPGGAATDLGTGGLILLSDLRPRIDEALALIQTLDVLAAPPTIETIPTQFLGATQLAALVTAASTARDAMMTPGSPAKGKVLPASDGNALILICPANEIEFWKSLIARFDQRQLVSTQSYSPRYFSAVEVAKLVEQAGRDSSPRGSGERWKVVVDDLSGSLIVTANAEEQTRVAELIARLDSMPREARRPVKVFPIRNRGVHEFVTVLSSLLEAGVLEGSSDAFDAVGSVQAATESRSTTRVPPAVSSPSTSTTTGDTPAGASVANPVGTASSSSTRVATAEGSHASKSRSSNQSGTAAVAPPSLTLTADEPTNSIIAIGDPRKLAELESLIKRLDVRQPQVMIEVMVVSLTDSDSLDLGVELQKIEVFGNTTVSLASLFGLGSPSLLSSKPPVTTSKGGSGIVLSPGDFSVVVRALQALNKGRTLTLPKVLVNNNQQAKLDSVLQQPFVSTNASTTVATTSFGGSENAGTVITIKPQIAEADHLVLEYSVSLSAFVGEASDPTVPPPKQSNNLSSIVTIPDGYTVVVGGLEIASHAEAVSQVPLLGSIPGVGELFKNRANSSNRSRFFVFIHSEVLRRENFEDLKFISDENAGVGAAAIDDGWPIVEPRVIK